MNVYDTANKLAKEIEDSKEYKEYKKLKTNIKVDSTKKEKVEEFEQLRYNMQLEIMKGNNSNVEENKELLEKKYAELLQDDEIKNYFNAEMQFNIMIADVNKIIAEAVKDVL